jgi:phenylpyruvate tautomerase PptA (4-oxalocrotonate tautomerase family)
VTKWKDKRDALISKIYTDVTVDTTNKRDQEVKIIFTAFLST